MKPVLKNALIDAVATALYVFAVGSFLFYGGEAKIGQAHVVLVPIVMLSLFVFSAAFTGVLMFGKPVLWYLDGRKEEALALVAWTLGIFFLITLIALLGLVAYPVGNYLPAAQAKIVRPMTE